MPESYHFGSLGLSRLSWRVPGTLRVFAPGTSLRRRVVYSLAIVRLILFPVIVLLGFYLYEMSRIVDQIVRIDAQVATLAESVSIQMLNARRMEFDYLLFHDPQDYEGSRRALAQMQETLGRCAELRPEDLVAISEIQSQIASYRSQFKAVAQQTGSGHKSANARFQEAVRAYERKLDSLIQRSSHESRRQLLADLRNQSGSFDSQTTALLASENPSLRKSTQSLQASSARILRLSAALETSSWNRVRQDHHKARRLMHRAEWVLSIVSAVAIILSVLVSYILPRQVVKPLINLKEAVDRAAGGNYEIEFDVKGSGEVAQLAHSVRDLIHHVSEKKESSVK